MHPPFRKHGKSKTMKLDSNTALPRDVLDLQITWSVEGSGLKHLGMGPLLDLFNNEV